jgi:membrane protein DedA with SNARE-associated domain
MEQIFQDISQWYMAHINYGTIILLMAVESSFFPLPSEIVIPPAAFKAAEGELNMYLVMACGTIGSVIGALFNYFLSITLGRAIIYKLADTRLAAMLLINVKSVQKAEAYFIRNGKSSTLVGRLVPVIRHLISIPAGLSKMNIFDFIIYTLIGSAIWNVILTLLGYFLYSQKEILHKYYTEISYLFLILGIGFIFYAVYKGIRKKKSS